MTDYAVHRCHLFEYTPKSVQCMASYEPPEGAQDDTKILAVGRENGAIELMKLTEYGFYTYMTVSGSSERNLEALLFCDGRLFSAELQGVISEYDLKTGIPKYSEDSYSGAVWCLAAGKGNKKIAAGCEDGRLKIYDCSEERIKFEKAFDKQEGRILSCAFHPENEILVSGSVDVIRIWSYKTGHAIQRIRVEAAKNRENIVWDVKILSDHTIISGDSTGKVSFWNGKNATLIHAFQNHCADVLSLCVSADESVVYAAGVDPKVIALHRSTSEDADNPQTQLPIGMESPPKKVSTWIKGPLIQTHSHDVRALALVGDFLASGSVDTNIMLSNTKKTVGKRRHTITPFPHQSTAHLACLSRMLLLQYPRHLDIWKLGTPESRTGQVGEQKTLIEEPTKIFQINAPLSDPCEISHSAISECGRWIAFASKTTFKLFWLNWNKDDPTDLSVTKSPARWVKLPSATVFSPDSNYAIIASFTGKIYVTKLDKAGHAHLEHVVKDEHIKSKEPVVLLAANNEFFSAVDLENRIFVYFLSKRELKCIMPGHSSIPTAISFKPATNFLIVAYQDQSVVEFDVESHSYTDWCKKAIAAELRLIAFPKKYYRARPSRISNWNTTPIVHISFSEIGSDRIMLSSSKSVFMLEYSIKMMENVIKLEEKRKKLVKGGVKSAWKIPEGFECPVKQFFSFEHLLYGSFLDSGTSMLAVERPWREIFDNLPPTLYQKKYGT